MTSFIRRRLACAVFLPILLGLNATTSSLAARADAKPTEADRKLAEMLAKAGNAQDCGAVLTILKPRLGKEPIHPTLELRAYELGTMCAGTSGDTALANRWATQATASPDASDYLWRIRLWTEIKASRYADGVRTVEAMRDTRGATLNALPQELLFELQRALTDTKMAHEKRRLLAVLTSSAYLPDKLLSSADSFRKSYARLLIDDGNAAKARSIVADIHNTDILISLLIDPRFKGLIAEPFDERASVEKELAVARAAMKSHDHHLLPLITTAGLLRALGRYEEALTILETARVREGGPEKYADADENLNWWWDSLSRASMSLGKVDAALSALRAGADENENGTLNVSQTINLAQTYVTLQRPAEALKTLEPAEAMQVSAFGAMQLRQARACAATQAGDKEIAEPDIAFVKAHGDDAPDALISVLLCIGDFDAAAKTVIARLDNSEQRADMLAQLVDYDPPPSPEGDSATYRNMEMLKARSDVTAAMERFGGRRRIRLQDASW